MTIIRRKLDPSRLRGLSEDTLRRMDALTPDQIEANALSDPDNPPLTEEELKRGAFGRKRHGDLLWPVLGPRRCIRFSTADFGRSPGWPPRALTNGRSAPSPSQHYALGPSLSRSAGEGAERSEAGEGRISGFYLPRTAKFP